MLRPLTRPYKLPKSTTATMHYRGWDVIICLATCTERGYSSRGYLYTMYHADEALRGYLNVWQDFTLCSDPATSLRRARRHILEVTP